ncbi:MAG: copper chaperone PCu(A)C [Alphaproteobacteria bacterium]|nr:copper chaperone PCu(A)C [Alphaproteobacteria bacterium]MBU2380378.1 copper chaperone PCu(A)C [Alphaproteobacteria bacterium]
MKRMSAIAILATAMALTACGQPASSGKAEAVGPVMVTGAICRPTPKGRQVTGCYLTVTSPADDTLVSIASPVAALAQIHESRMESNMMMMRELEAGLPLPAGQAVSLAPGANHIMLLGVNEPLRTGDTVPLTLTFATAAPVQITAAVGQPPAA